MGGPLGSSFFIHIFSALAGNCACAGGVECDQMVLSDGESSGTVTSPNYPRNYPINVSCHYYIDGLVDKQNLEKVKFLFDDFDLPTVPEGSVH